MTDSHSHTGSNGSPSHGAGLSRREMLLALGAGCASLLSAPALAGHFPFKRQANGTVRKGQILNQKQMAQLRSMVDIVLPATQTLSAGSVDTHGFIDDQLVHCVDPAEAQRFINALDKANNFVQQQWKQAYQDLPLAKQNEAMQAIASKKAPFDQLDDFFSRLKSLTVMGYYTSQEGGSKELVYLPLAGGYDGDYTLAQNGGKAFMPHQI